MLHAQGGGGVDSTSIEHTGAHIEGIVCALIAILECNIKVECTISKVYSQLFTFCSVHLVLLYIECTSRETEK